MNAPLITERESTVAYRPAAAEMYERLRSSVLTLNPAEVGLAPSDRLPHVWGVVTDIGYEQAVATVVALADGTTSLYLSSGGGTIGGGAHESVAAATVALLELAEVHLADLPPGAPADLPEAGHVALRVLTYDGRRTVVAAEAELIGEHRFGMLYRAVHDVITQLRLVEEARGE